MQHFGAPTRLLDWTASPYVALYFAVVSNWSRDGAVWMFNPVAIRDACDDPEILSAYQLFEQQQDTVDFLWGRFPPQFLYPFGTQLSHIRIVTQQGRFTLCGDIPSDHGRLIDSSHTNENQGYYHKIVIAADKKPVVLNKLARMNITANALFPGLDGLGKSIEELVKLEAEYVHRGVQGFDEGYRGSPSHLGRDD